MTVSAATPPAAKSTGTCPTACIASVWNGTPVAAASAASSATGWTVPTSLLAHITVTSGDLVGVRGDDLGQRVGADPAERRRPAASVTCGALVVGQPVDRVEHRVVLDRAGHHPPTRRVGRPAAPRRCP